MREFKVGDLLRIRDDHILLLVDIDANPTVKPTTLGYVILSGVLGWPCISARVGGKVDDPPSEFHPKDHTPIYYLGNIEVFSDALANIKGEHIEM